jgi:hypothetical protein
MNTYLNSLIGRDDDILLDPAAFAALANWLKLRSRLDAEITRELLSEAEQAHGAEEKTGAEAVATQHRAIYERRFRIKRTTLLAILATLVSTPMFLSTFPGSLSWQQLTAWLAGLLGINTVQLVGFFEALFETSRLELSHDEESVVQAIVSVPQSAESIRRQIHARFPEFTERELDNIFERLTSHGFLIAGHDAKGERTYRLNLKWKKIVPQP